MTKAIPTIIAMVTPVVRIFENLIGKAPLVRRELIRQLLSRN